METFNEKYKLCNHSIVNINLLENKLNVICNDTCGLSYSSNFDPKNITEKEKKLIKVFDCFVNLNSFLMATFGTLYFNLQDIGLLDYILKSDIIKDYKDELEMGKTEARIFFNLFNHLILFPDNSIKLYLKANFPKNFKLYESGKRDILFSDIDYYKGIVKEERFETYKDAFINY